MTTPEDDPVPYVAAFLAALADECDATSERYGLEKPERARLKMHGDLCEEIAAQLKGKTFAQMTAEKDGDEA